MKKINNHGDLIIYPIKKIKPPKDAISSNLHILQRSETTGNRHEVFSKSKPIYLWNKDGIDYIHCDEDYIIRHIGGDCEHGEQPVSSGTAKILREVEYDPWKNELKIVID